MTTLAPPRAVTIPAATLKAATSWVTRTLATRPAVPILGGLVLRAGDGLLTMSAFDYETHATATIPADGDLDVLVPGRVFADAVARLAGDVRLELDGAQLVVASGRQTFRLGVMDTGDYPAVPAGAAAAGSIDAEDLQGLVQRAAVAAAHPKDSGDMNLHSVRLAAAGGTLMATATNRYIANRGSTPWAGRDFDAAVPAVTLAGALKGMTGAVDLGANGTHLTLAATDRTVSISLIAGRLAEVDRVFGMNRLSEQTAHLDRSELADAVAASRVSIDRGKALVLDFTPGSLDVSASGDTSSATAVLDAAGDADIVHHVNPDYLADIIGATPGPRVHVTVGTGPAKPFLTRGADGNGEPIDGCDYLLVPIRMTDGAR